MPTEIAVGEKAPALTLPATGDSTIHIPSNEGKRQVIFFYPRDNTPGCTTEAKAFSALKAEFERRDVEIIGISRDSLASHDKFVDKQGLNIRLASDEDGKATEAFGVWVEKNMYGRKFMGIERSTFVIEADGTVSHIWRKVKVKGHAEEVLGKL